MTVLTSKSRVRMTQLGLEISKDPDNKKTYLLEAALLAFADWAKPIYKHGDVEAIASFMLFFGINSIEIGTKPTELLAVALKTMADMDIPPR